VPLENLVLAVLRHPGDSRRVKKTFAWSTPEKALEAEGRYWRRLSIAARVSAVEIIREASLGIYDEATPPNGEGSSACCMASGRPKDLLDIALLEEAAPPARRPRKVVKKRPLAKRRPTR